MYIFKCFHRHISECLEANEIEESMSPFETHCPDGSEGVMPDAMHIDHPNLCKQTCTKILQQRLRMDHYKYSV